MRQFQIVRTEIGQQRQPDGWHRGGDRHAHVQQFIARGRVEHSPGQYTPCSNKRNAKSRRPAIGVEQRNDRHNDIGRRQPQHILLLHDQAVDDVRTVRVENTLRIARGSRGKADPAGVPLVARNPVAHAVLGFDQFLIAKDIRQRGLGHMRPIGHHNVSLNLRQVSGDCLQHRNDVMINKDPLVLGVIDHKGQLLDRQARVQRMQDTPGTRHAVPDFQVPCCVPCHTADHVAALDAQPDQRLGQLHRAGSDLAPVRMLDRSLDRPRDDLTARVILGGVVEDVADPHLPVLHQSLHGNLPIALAAN